MGIVDYHTPGQAQRAARAGRIGLGGVRKEGGEIEVLELFARAWEMVDAKAALPPQHARPGGV